jgi:hypothetical protein
LKPLHAILIFGAICFLATLVTWQILPTAKKSHIKNLVRPYVETVISLRKNRAVTNGPLCTSKLAGRNLEYSPIADRTNAKGCKVSNAIRLSKVGDLELSKPADLTCEMALNLSIWVESFVKPKARSIFNEEITTLSHLGSYNCRPMRGKKTRLSQHAFANAFDVAGFRLASGEKLDLKKDWKAGGKKEQFWRSIHKGACKNFDLVLGPEFDKRHKDHFHLDAGYYKSCR